MDKLKVSAAQIIALRSATQHANGSYELTTVKTQTVSAFERAGIVIVGTRFLTIQGVSVMHSVSHADIVPSKGHTVPVSNDGDATTLFTLPSAEDAQTDAQGSGIMADWERELLGIAPSLPVVTSEPSADLNIAEGDPIQGEDPSQWAPMFESPRASECFFGCGMPTVAVFVNTVGITEGLCMRHRTHLEDMDIKTYDIPANVLDGVQSVVEHIASLMPISEAFKAQSATESPSEGIPTVCVMQNTPGMAGPSHYHAPGCRDIMREMKRFGQTSADVIERSFADVAAILVFEDGGRGSDHAPEFTPEWWSVVMYNASEEVSIMPCLSIPAGRVGNSPLVTSGNFFRAGFDLPSIERVAEIRTEIDAHTCDEPGYVICATKAAELWESSRPKFPCYGENGKAVHISPCAQADGINGPCCAIDIDGTDLNARKNNADFKEGKSVIIAGLADCPVTLSRTDSDPGDAGFMEILVMIETHLFVSVDEEGTEIDLGWHTFTLNAAQQHDHDAIAELYGKRHGKGNPRDGWGSIIRVADVDLLGRLENL
jgi:hypothetical protein